MTRIAINPTNGESNYIAGWGNYHSSGAGVKVADCPDLDTGEATGISFEVTTAMSVNSGSVSDLAGERWPLDVWRLTHYGDLGAALKNLPPGAPYTLYLAAKAASSDRHTDFTVDGVTLRYETVLATATPNPPVVFTGTVPADGILTITSATVGPYAYFNGAELVIDDAPTIGIPSDALQFEGEVQASKTGIKLRVTSGTSLTGAELYNVVDGTTDAAGLLQAIDLTETAATDGGNGLLHVLTADGKSGIFPVVFGAL